MIEFKLKVINGEKMLYKCACCGDTQRWNPAFKLIGARQSICPPCAGYLLSRLKIKWDYDTELDVKVVL